MSVHLANLYVSKADRKYLIEDTILNLVRRGIRSKKESTVNHSIDFLGYMAAQCPDVHPVLKDLSHLANEEDPDVDFFKNLQHLQLLRKGRALRKFFTVTETLNQPPNPRTLTQFILPLVSSYLCNDDYLNKNSIVDDAILAVASVCRLLPWYHYETILKYYLGKLKFIEYQKQVVRIIVAILDAFHYDLSKLSVEQQNIEKPVEKVQDEEAQVPAEAMEVEESKNEEEKDIFAEAIEEKDEEEELDMALVEEEGVESEEKVMTRQLVLSGSECRKVIRSISQGLLPQLQRAIAARTQYEKSHKLNRKDRGMAKEEEELMRVPIALAVVKLMQKLPGTLLKKNLPGYSQFFTILDWA